MSKITNEISVGKYKILKLDVMPTTPYTFAVINGRKYTLIPTYDAPDCIAIESQENFVGTEVIFE